MKHQPLIFATFLSPVLYKTCLYIIEYLEQLTGIPTFLLPGEDLDDFAAGAIDAGFISGLAYIHLTNQQPVPIELAAVPVLEIQKTHYQHTPLALSDIVVRKSSSYTTVDDLQGCVWACTLKGDRENPSYADSQLAYEAFFEQMPFKERIMTCSHLQSLRLLLDGTVDAAIIHSSLLDEIFEQSAKMNAQLRLVGSFNSRTVPPVVISTHVDAQMRQHIAEALLSMHQHSFYGQRLHESSIERFLPATELHYEPIRKRYRKVQTP